MSRYDEYILSPCEKCSCMTKTTQSKCANCGTQKESKEEKNNEE